MEQMREQRVKQLASRIIEAALGIGRIKSAELRAGSKRPRNRVDLPCHAIAIENLTNYRPEEIRTRRENRQLMNWSAAKVKKFLSEGCLLNGLHLREISPAYTSRQDSRTGQPGMRCTDVSPKEFAKRHWRTRVKQAEKKNDAESQFLVDINNQLDGKTTLRLPQKSGELFISINGQTRQADLNAAANIGLRALMDSDWQGKWWYVPCQASNGKPDPDRIKGSVAIPVDQPLITVGGGKAKKDVINLWRDCSNEPLKEGQFKVYDEYWNGVRSQVTGRLYGINGIEPKK
jgi:IS605 OrfB family transposase